MRYITTCAAVLYLAVCDKTDYESDYVWKFDKNVKKFDKFENIWYK